MNEYGTFIEGEFTGYEGTEAYPQLSIRTGEPTETSKGYCTRIDFTRFSNLTGKPTLPFEPKIGDTLRAKVITKAKIYEKDGIKKAMVTMFAVQVTKL